MAASVGEQVEKGQSQRKVFNADSPFGRTTLSIPIGSFNLLDRREDITVRNVHSLSKEFATVTEGLHSELLAYVRSSCVETRPHGLTFMKDRATLTIALDRPCVAEELAILHKRGPGAKWEVLQNKVTVADDGKFAVVKIGDFCWWTIVERVGLQLAVATTLINNVAGATATVADAATIAVDGANVAVAAVGLGPAVVAGVVGVGAVIILHCVLHCDRFNQQAGYVRTARCCMSIFAVLYISLSLPLLATLIKGTVTLDH